MAFGNAWDLDCLRPESWFRAGDLSFSESATRPFISSPRHDTQAELNDNDVTSLENSDINHFRLWFKLRSSICSRKPQRCLPIMVANNPQEHVQQISHIRTNISEAESPFFGPRREMEELFGVTGDPESLDDSYIVELLASSQPGDTNNTLKDKMNKISLLPTYLLVSLNSVYIAGEPSHIPINHGIIDCQIFDTLPERLGSLILISTSSGYLISIILGIGQSKAAIVQYWELGSAGDWHIVKHQSHEQFVAVNKKKGLCKFFCFRNALHFTLVNNLSIDNTQFLDCLFFPNTSQSHYLLFVPSIRYHRLVFFCIEWDNTAPAMKDVYQLTYLNGHLIDCCVPVGNNRSLVFHGSDISLISAHQIMSGETNFKHFESKLLKGVCSYFEAPQLLAKLKRIHGEPFNTFQYCTLLATSSGNIIICVMDDQDRIEFFSLTRFKGLKDVCPVCAQSASEKEYELVVISFGRTLLLTIDIADITRLTGEFPIPSLSGIQFKHTLDSSTEDNFKLLVISPPKTASRFSSEIWLASSMAISHLQTFAPVRKLHEVCKLRQFQLYNKIQLFRFSSLENGLKKALLQDGHIQHPLMYLVVATDSLSVSKAFLLNLHTPEITVVELDDFLAEVEGGSLDAFFSQKGSLVQITRDSVYLDLLGLSPEEQTEEYSPGWEIEGVAHCGNKIIVWNCVKKKCNVINNIDDLGKGQQFVTSVFLENEMRLHNSKSVEFCIVRDEENANTTFVYLATNSGLSRCTWDALYTVNDPTFEFQSLCDECSDSLLSLSSHLCFIKNDSQFVKANYRHFHIAEVQLRYNTKDFQIRPFDEESCLIFSTQEITVYSVSATKEKGTEIYELKLPPSSKVNPILDVSADAENNRIFVLYSDGLEVYDLSYFTWNSSNYLLRSTKTTEKKFLFVEKINRMIVVNLRAREWDCIKLVDGKTLSLDPSTLQSPADLKLIDVVEIYSAKRHVELLLQFGTLLKLVRLVPKRGRISVQEMSRYEFSAPLFNHIEVGNDGRFLVFLPAIPASPHHPFDYFMQMHVDQNDQLELLSSLKFPEQINLQCFRLCGKDVIIVSKVYDRVFLLKDFSRQISQKYLQAISLKMPLSSKVLLVCPLGGDSFVVVVSCEGRSDHITELLFYHRDDVKLSGESKKAYADGGDLLYEAAMLDDAQRQVESEISRIEEEEDDAQENFNEHEEMMSISAATQGDDWDLNYRDFLHRMANGRLGQGEEWDFDDLDMEYEVEEDDEVAQGSEEDEDMLDTDDMDEMDEFDAFERGASNSFPLDLDPELEDSATAPEVASADLVRPVTASTNRKPYQVMHLTKAIKDIKYDCNANAIYLLAMDSSVLVLSQASKQIALQSIVQKDTSKTRDNSFPIKTTQSGLFALDADGHVPELPWL
ncbi:uncharacterized protein ZBAI_07512 [Zygosaccharomyces bailii ISA1307]|uniref:BN860_01244g1_1 n=1 Tax=Zygosaccharomyces bailii (strain CLIB 213 / ATCC 58445 / CBS 680 / BCRC 21525 / NBRC 1098 / NCYC 1416 / NRRL Y-2227) TaxID=1333698 RepID=A0A8J2X7T5_ZYGB2|nr:BN860_01244g1_1 [Zygosaccharomyces bailii CLIB 213]CDH15725.1 uncharacterized protein ZBAI_07512 [Zygosaccharomyces bailii ISA1307]